MERNCFPGASDLTQPTAIAIIKMADGQRTTETALL